MMHRQAVQIRAVEQVTDNFATALNVDWAHGEPVAEIVAKHGGAAMYVTDGATAGRVQIPLSKLCVKLIEIRVRVSWKSSDVIPKQGRDCRRHSSADRYDQSDSTNSTRCMPQKLQLQEAISMDARRVRKSTGTDPSECRISLSDGFVTWRHLGPDESAQMILNVGGKVLQRVLSTKRVFDRVIGASWINVHNLRDRPCDHRCILEVAELELAVVRHQRPYCVGNVRSLSDRGGTIGWFKPRS